MSAAVGMGPVQEAPFHNIWYPLSPVLLDPHHICLSGVVAPTCVNVVTGLFFLEISEKIG